MDLGLRGRTVLVCGGSRGIGYAAADQFAAEGAHLAICARDPHALTSAAERLSRHGGRVVTMAADLSERSGIAAAITAVTDAYGGVDVLVTNTGGPPTGSALAPDWEAWQRASDLLLRSAVELSRAFVPGMQERRWGRVIGITSMAVKQPVASLVLSNALRAAVTGFYRTLANEVSADGLTVNTVLPGYVETERLQSLAAATTARTGAASSAVYDEWRAAAPAHRLGTADELGAVIAFLASERAGFITGQAISVDGGAVRTLF